MLSSKTILVVEDEPSLRETLKIALEREGYEVFLAEGVEEGISCLKEEEIDLVLTDMRLKEKNGLDILRFAKRIHPSIEVIVMTAYGSIQDAVNTMKEGAYDYLQKPFSLDELKILVRRALEKKALGEENIRLRERYRQISRKDIPELVGISQSMGEVLKMIERVSQVDTTLLITGESGVGKEVVARKIHLLSPRSRGPFIGVNCGAIPESLIEAELFGYEKGAFTSADHSHPGLLEQAEGGILFLDEVVELPLTAQVKLLRVLQEGKIRRLGGRKEIPLNVRFICATNRDIEKRVREGTFREDLYYRIHVLRIHIPPLRERKEDIPYLAKEILSSLSKKLGIKKPSISPEVLEAFSHYPFPGNVRELENLLERALILSKGETLTLAHFPPEMGRGDKEIIPSFLSPTTIPENFHLEEYLKDMEKSFIASALKQAGGVKQKAAEILGLSFRQFRYKAKKYGF